MRRAMLMVLVCLASACNDDGESLALDASTPDAAAPIDASTVLDASGPGDASVPRSLLPRPGTLERPPTTLPDELKPPR